MTTINFLKHSKLYFAISLALLIPGLISLLTSGLRLSIDFTGGSLVEVQTRTVVDPNKVRESASKLVEVSSVQSAGDKSYIIRTKLIDQAKSDELVKQLNTDLEGAFASKFESVGPTVGGELTRKALLAVAVASICIVAYIAWAFRSIPKQYSPLKFGLSAVVALLHDALMLLGIFSILGRLHHVEVDSLFVTAVLTVIGFSVHDTIVVFDRIRENLAKLPKSSFTEVTNFSLTETLGRSLNTSLTVLLTLSALLFFGGESIRWFIVALFVGIASGTYSSIFNAAPLLAIWEERKKK